MGTTPPKTIPWCFPTVTGAAVLASTSFALSALTSLGTVTIEIPESSVTFLSVVAVPHWRDANSAGIRTDAYRLRAQLGAAGTSDTDTTYANLQAQTGDHESHSAPVDLTAYFIANWSGTSMALQLWLAVNQQSAGLIQNMSAIVYVTYTHADTDDIRVWAAEIPIQSESTTLTASQQELGRDGANPVGASQIPALDSFIADRYTAGAVPVIVGSALRFRCNDNGSPATTDFALVYQIDAAGEVTGTTIEQALATSTYFEHIGAYAVGTFAQNATHTLKARGDLTGRFRNCAADLIVAWKYSEAATIANNRVTVSEEIPWGGPGFRALEGASAGEEEVHRFFLHVGEPGTITILQSAAYLRLQNASGGIVSVSVWAGSQSERSYVGPTAWIAAGEWPITHRVDHGSGWTLTNGDNLLFLRTRADNLADTNVATLHGIKARINYQANCPAGGSHLRGSTTVWYGGGWGNAAANGWNGTSTSRMTLASGTAKTPTLPAHYKVSAYWSELRVRGAAQLWGTIAQSLVSGEQGYIGHISTQYWQVVIDAEASGCNIPIIPWLGFKAFDQDQVTTRPAISTARGAIVRLGSSSDACGLASLRYLTMHACDWTVSGTVRGYTGDGSGLTVDVRRASDDTWVASATTAAGGGYTAHCYEGGAHVADVRQSASRQGRSDNVTPTG